MKKGLGVTLVRILLGGLAVFGLVLFLYEICRGQMRTALNAGIFTAAMAVGVSQQRHMERQQEEAKNLAMVSRHFGKHFQYQNTVGKLCAKAARAAALKGDANIRKALDLLDQAAERAWYKEDRGAVLFLKANIVEDAGRRREAIEILRKSLELDRDNPDAWNMIGYLLVREMGEPCYQEAERAYMRAHELAPDDTTVWNNLGVFYNRTGNLRESRKWLEKALVHHPLPSVYSALALVEAREGAEEAAWDYYAQAEKIGYRHLENLRSLIQDALAQSRRRTSAADQGARWEEYNKEWHT